METNSRDDSLSPSIDPADGSSAVAMSQPAVASSEIMPAAADSSPKDATASLPVRRNDPLTAADILKYLYNHNPFYPISAILILLGLHSIFFDAESAKDIGDITFRNGVLMVVLAAYSLLLAVISCLIVRLGNVWDDARTILISIVLLIVTMSINCDKPILEHDPFAPYFLIGALLFSIGLSEGIFRTSRIDFPWLARLPYYGFLALFFLYPVALNHFLHTVGDLNNAEGKRLTQLGIILFPTVAALVGLTLIPAAIRGPSLVATNRTPWIWPLYPWSVFVMLAVAVVLRAYYLTISFHARNGMESEFGIYLMTPFLLVVAAIVFELAKSVGNRDIEHSAMVLPILLLCLTLNDGKYLLEGSLEHLYCLHFSSPIQVALGGTALLWGYGLLRGGPAWLKNGVSVPFILLAFNYHGIFSLGGTISVAWLWAALAVILLQALFSRGSSYRWFLAVATACFCLMVTFRNSPFMAYQGAIPIHLSLLAILLISIICRDTFIQTLRRIASIGMVALACRAAIITVQIREVSPQVYVLLYVAVIAIAGWGYWILLRDNERFRTACLLSAIPLINLITLLVIQIRQTSNPLGFLLVLGGILSLFAALAISTFKIRIHSHLPHQSELASTCRNA